MNSALFMNSAIDSSIDNQIDLGNSLSPALLACITIVIIVYYFIFSRFTIGNMKAPKASPSIASQTLEIFIWAIFIVILIINGVQYYYNINIKTD